MKTEPVRPRMNKLLDEILSRFQGDIWDEQRCSDSRMPANRNNSAVPQGAESQPSKAFVESVRKRIKAS